MHGSNKSCSDMGTCIVQVQTTYVTCFYYTADDDDDDTREMRANANLQHTIYYETHMVILTCTDIIC